MGRVGFEPTLLLCTLMLPITSPPHLPAYCCELAAPHVFPCLSSPLCGLELRWLIVHDVTRCTFAPLGVLTIAGHTSRPNFLGSHALFYLMDYCAIHCCGSRTRTCNLWLMRPTNFLRSPPQSWVQNKIILRKFATTIFKPLGFQTRYFLNHQIIAVRTYQLHLPAM